MTLNPLSMGWVSLEKPQVLILAEVIWEFTGLLRPRKTHGQWEFGHKVCSQQFAYTKIGRHWNWLRLGASLGVHVGWLTSGPKGCGGAPLGTLRNPHCLLCRIGICLWTSSAPVVSPCTGNIIDTKGSFSRLIHSPGDGNIRTVGIDISSCKP